MLYELFFSQSLILSLSKLLTSPPKLPCVCVCVCVYMYIYTYRVIYIYIYVDIQIFRALTMVWDILK
jgi:hypothetical protein